MSYIDEIQIKRVTDSKEIYEILGLCQKVPFFDELREEDNRNATADRLSKFGFVIAAYFEDALIAFISGYANDEKDKIAHVSAVVKDPESGLLGSAAVVLLYHESAKLMLENGMITSMGKVEKGNDKSMKLQKSMGMKYHSEGQDGFINFVVMVSELYDRTEKMLARLK